MDRWPSEESMMKLAMENNLSETAFIVMEPEGYHLRWFTPGTEVELCGHATLASSFVILNFYELNSNVVRFTTMSGLLTVRKKGNLYEMDFPTYEMKEIPVTDAMERAFGIRPIRAVIFGDRCEVCYACLHNCPKKAIHLPVEKADARFRNEHVSLNDIIRSNE